HVDAEAAPSRAGNPPAAERGGGNAEIPPGRLVGRIEFGRPEITTKRLRPVSLALVDQAEVIPGHAPAGIGRNRLAKPRRHPVDPPALLKDGALVVKSDGLLSPVHVTFGVRCAPAAPQP